MARNRWLSDSETSLVFMPSSRLARDTTVRLCGQEQGGGSVVVTVKEALSLLTSHLFHES